MITTHVQTPLEASSESKHASDLSSLLFSLPHPSSPLHGHHHRPSFTPSSLLHTSTSLGFSPHLLPPWPLVLLFSPHFPSPHLARSPVCLLRPVILTALLLLLPRPSVVSFPSPLSPLWSPWVLSSSPSPGLHSPPHPPVFSLLHPVFLLSDQALFSLHPFLRLVSVTLVIHADTVLV